VTANNNKNLPKQILLLPGTGTFTATNINQTIAGKLFFDWRRISDLYQTGRRNKSNGKCEILSE